MKKHHKATKTKGGDWKKKNSAFNPLAFLFFSLDYFFPPLASPPRHGHCELVFIPPLCSPEMAPKKDANAGGDESASAASAQVSADAVRKMKVGDLRSALEARGLDSKGLKADLVERLLEATGQVREGYAEERGRETEEESTMADSPVLLTSTSTSLSSPRIQTADARTNTGRRSH